jgi:hypothetical protein
MYYKINNANFIPIYIQDSAYLSDPTAVPLTPKLFCKDPNTLSASLSPLSLGRLNGALP